MSAIETARRVLADAGCTCRAGGTAGFAFDGPDGGGTVEITSATTVRVSLRPPDATDDPVTLARLSARAPAGVRITVHDGHAVAFGTCRAGDAACLLPRLSGLRHRPHDTTLPVEDVTIGAFDVAVGEPAAPVFFRLGDATGREVGAARALYVLVANVALRSGKGGWVVGPGLIVESAPVDRAVLRRELLEAGHACAALGDPAVARSYLDLWKVG